jgi:hypothetical protein
MVKKVVTYECEWQGCNNSYTIEKEATKCENQKMIGPQLRPGFVFNRLPYKQPIIIMNEKSEGHVRRYDTLELSDNLVGLIDSSKRNNLFKVLFRVQDYPSENFLEKSGFSEFVNEKDFFKLVNIINEGKSTDLVRNVLKINKIENFFYLQKDITL